jgi:hypothetical protein
LIEGQLHQLTRV